MMDEMRAECIEFSITACEKFAANYEVRLILNLASIHRTHFFSDGCTHNKRDYG